MNEPIPFQPSDRATGAAQFFSRVQRYKTLLKRRWWVLLLTLGIAVGAQTYRASRQPLTFVSKAQMIVGNRTTVTDAAAAANDENFVGTTIALFKGNLISTRASEMLRTNEPHLPRSPVVLDVSLVPKTSIFLLQARGTYSKYTQAYLNACMEEFLEYRKEIRGKTSDETIQAVTVELRKAREKIAEGQRELAEFQKQLNVASVEEEARSTALNLAKLKDEFSTTQRELLLLMSLKAVPSVQRPKDKADAAPALEIRDRDKAREELAILEQKKHELEEYLKPAHPKMV